MSSSPIPVIGSIHHAWYAKAATWLLNVGKHVKAGVLRVAGAEPKIAAVIAEYAPTVEDISNLFIPGSGNFEQHLLTVWGVTAAAIKGAGDVASANGLSVSFDAALVAEIRAILPAVEAFLHPAASPAPPKA